MCRLWQRSWSTSLMEAPGRRATEEQEPSDRATLQCLAGHSLTRSHDASECRLSA